MTQLYTEILETETLTNSRALILNNDKTIMSCSSGTAFPTANLQVGMLCLRTDQNKLYQLKDATPTWTLIGDLLMDYNTVVQAKGNISTTTGDWNTYVTAGVYQVGGANWTGSTNGPNTAKATLTSNGQLIVTVFGSVVMQTYVAHSASLTGGVYFRLKYNATDWIPWSIQWNSTNDGAGSGLDADLLDGENLVDNAATANTVVGRDANGDIFVVTLRGTNINITGSAVLGDAVTDTHTINGSPTITGDLFMQNNKEIRWDGNTDFAEIMYISTSDAAGGSRLRIGVGDNGDEIIEFGQYNGATFTPRLTINGDGSVTIGNFSATGNVTLGSGVGNNHLFNGSVRITNQLVVAQGDNVIRNIGNSAYLSFHNSADTVRTGYMQYNAGGSLVIASENGSEIRLIRGGAIWAMDSNANIVSGVPFLGGSYPDHACRAFAKMERSGTTAVLQRAGGVSSVQFVAGTFRVRFNFSYTLPTDQYAVVVSGRTLDTDNDNGYASPYQGQTTTYVDVTVADDASVNNADMVAIAVFY